MTTDLTTLCAEITRLHRTLTALRVRYANLLAAVRAAVAAHEDGEADPMAYLYDELPDHPPHSAVNADHHDDAGTAGNGK
jgi:hypothetical protein